MALVDLFFVFYEVICYCSARSYYFRCLF